MGHRQRMVRAMVVSTVVVAVAAAMPQATAGPAAQPAAAAPTITVEPAGDLVDGQLVTVVGRDLPAETPRLAQCPAGAVTVDECDPAGTPWPPLDGQDRAPFRVRAILALPGGELDCRAPGACVVGLAPAPGGAAGLLATAPLPFVADGPIAPPPGLTVVPDDELRDGQDVTVTGTGFVRSHDPYVEVAQCAAEPRTWADCSAGRMTEQTDAAGSFSTTAPVASAIVTAAQGLVDCRPPGACVALATTAVGVAGQSATAPLSFAADTEPPAPLAIEATPASDLLDGQVVTVTGSGFVDAGQAIGFVHQCTPAPSAATCRTVDDHAFFPDGSGGFSVDVRVWATLPGEGGQVVDCRTSAEPCLLVAGLYGYDPARAPRAELRFADAPLRPLPHVTATPTDGLGDVTRLSVEGADFTPGTRAVVRLCPVGDAARCDVLSAERPTADDGGTFALETSAWSTWTAWPTGPVDCRQAPGCELRVSDAVHPVDARVPVAFGPPDAPRGRYLDPVFDDVETDTGVVYRTVVDHLGNEVELVMDIFRPAGDTATSRPAVVWMHGGWFVAGGPAGMHDFAVESARRGYVGVSLQYRLRPGMDTRDYPQLYDAMVDAYEDAAAGVDWLKEHAQEWGVDPDAIVAGGWSAGAVNASNLAYMPGQSGRQTSNVAAALPVAGWFVDPDDPALPLPGPFAVPDRGEPPALVFHGTDDQLLPFGSPRDLCPLAEAAGIACTYEGFEGDGHGIQSSRFRDIVRQGHDFVVDQVLRPAGYFDADVDAGGPYTVDEGSTVTLDGSAPAGTGGQVVAWSPAGRLDDPTSLTPTYAAGDDGVEVLTLSVTGAHGLSAADDAEITTANADPAVARAEATVTDRDVALEVEATDAGAADTHAAVVDWGDGTVADLAVDQGSGTALATGGHAYAGDGAYEVTVTVTDDDGGTASWHETVVVGCTIVGGPGTDILLGTRADDVICGLGGADLVLGLGGGDRLVGGDGGDIVVGGPGDDHLDGGPGADLLIGGPGRDSAAGGAGRDLCHAETRRECEGPAR